jgi:omega-amidase
MEDLHISLIQSDLYWESIEANLAMFEEKIWQIEGKTDLIVLPEMFNTGFTMEAAALAEPMNSRTFRWMKQQAAQTGAVVTGSYMIKEKGGVFNRLIWMKSDGQFAYYDKRHLFRMANEHHYFIPGKDLLVVGIKGWRVCPLVCYDLRFPVWSRNTDVQDQGFKYDLLLYVANWPSTRIDAWDILLKARAIENLSYVAGLNRVGKDGQEIFYNGHSAIYDYKGEEICFNEGEEIILSQKLSVASLESFRSKFPANLDADRFEMR